MRRIVLVRHGWLHWDFVTPIAGRDFAAWLHGEDHAPIDPSRGPPPELQHLVESAERIAASTLRRSTESAQLLAPTKPALVDAAFREAELPTVFHSPLRLPPSAWAGVARSRWFLGWSPGVESFKTARDRAGHAAEILVAQANSRGPVVLVGHGLMNIFIAARLRRAGWHGPVVPGQHHWGFSIFELDTSASEARTLGKGGFNHGQE